MNSNKNVSSKEVAGNDNSSSLKQPLYPGAFTLPTLGQPMQSKASRHQALLQNVSRSSSNQSQEVQQNSTGPHKQSLLGYGQTGLEQLNSRNNNSKDSQKLAKVLPSGSILSHDIQQKVSTASKQRPVPKSLFNSCKASEAPENSFTFAQAKPRLIPNEQSKTSLLHTQLFSEMNRNENSKSSSVESDNENAEFDYTSYKPPDNHPVPDSLLDRIGNGFKKSLLTSIDQPDSRIIDINDDVQPLQVPNRTWNSGNNIGTNQHQPIHIRHNQVPQASNNNYNQNRAQFTISTDKQYLNSASNSFNRRQVNNHNQKEDTRIYLQQQFFPNDDQSPAKSFSQNRAALGTKNPQQLEVDLTSDNEQNDYFNFKPAQQVQSSPQKTSMFYHRNQQPNKYQNQDFDMISNNNLQPRKDSELLSRYRKQEATPPKTSVTQQFYELQAAKQLGGSRDSKNNQITDSTFYRSKPQTYDPQSNTDLKKSNDPRKPPQVVKPPPDRVDKPAITTQTVDNSKMKERIQKSLYQGAGGKKPTNGTAFQISTSSSRHPYGINEYTQKKDSMLEIKSIVQKMAPKDKSGKEKDEELQKQKEIEKKQEEEDNKKKQLQEKNDLFSKLFGSSTKNDTPAISSKANQDESDIDFVANINSSIKAKHNDYDPKHLEEETKKSKLSGLAKMTQEDIQKAEKHRLIRYHNRKTVDELIRPILNLELVEMFQNQKREFEQVPLKFDSFQQYRDIWIPLFLYETYSQMINQRSDIETDKELLLAQGIKFNSSSSKKKYFEGYIKKTVSEHYYIEIQLYESAKSEPDSKGNFNMNIIDSLKEFDLLLITEEPLPIKEVKKLMNADYLLEMKKQKGKMLSIVSQRRKKDNAYINLKIDRQLHEEYMCVNVRQQDFVKVHVYFFDSLMTTVREFRTIKSCEFFPTAKFILDPTLINYMPQTTYLKENENLMRQQLQFFVNQHNKKFNDSQLQALEHVSKMKSEDFLLLQGPPGTGKTHTIQGIVSMLVSANVKRILICTPSNAALDEIVLRIATHKLCGTQTDVQLYDKLLRIGSLDYDPLPIVKRYTLDSKLKDRLDQQDTQFVQQSMQKDKNTAYQVTIDQKLDNIKQKLQQISTVRRIIREDKEKQEKSRLNEVLKNLFPKIEVVQRFYKLSKEERLKDLENVKKAYEDKEKEIKACEQPTQEQKWKPKSKRSEMEKDIIKSAQIICTTLSMSANDKLEIIQEDFEYLIVDEACQCIELTDLIPFSHNPKKIILVGDQSQLPATTFSENSEKTLYCRSLFERFLQCGVQRFMLSIQYRMHPLIREFPSNQFYEGKLQDAVELKSRMDSIANKTSSFILTELYNSIQNLVFFDLKYAKESTNDTSKSNFDEASFIKELFSVIIKILIQSKNFPERFQQSSYTEKMEFIGKELKSKIGIITPYKSQVRTLKDCIYPQLRQLNLPIDTIEINTVDAYQGREKDIIIISCVRASQERTLGFLNDYRRMNVAITRAKHFLWVIGNSLTLKRNENWDQFIQFTKSQQSREPELTEPSSPKSSKCSCYIQLQTREQWDDHKLMNILKGGQNCAEDRSVVKEKRFTEEHKERAHQRFDDKRDVDQNLAKRGRYDDDKSQEKRFHEQRREHKRYSPNLDRKRDQKHAVKNDERSRPEDTLKSDNIRTSISLSAGSTDVPKADITQDAASIKKAAPSIDDIFNKAISSIGGGTVNKRPSDSALQPKPAGDIFSRIQKH